MTAPVAPDPLDGHAPMACPTCKDPQVMVTPTLGHDEHYAGIKIPAAIWECGGHWKRIVPLKQKGWR